LLVDDHNLFRQALSVILERHMDLEENVQARSRAEARQAFSDLEGKVDLAIVDLSLPEGTEPIQELHHLDVPVLAITAGPSQERCARAGGGDE
jgi:DNA-binding NarL/FixJ family response regulator